MSKKVLVIGIDGMLGNECFMFLNKNPRLEVVGTSRKRFGKQIVKFDVLVDSTINLINQIQPDWIINCVGLIRQKMSTGDFDSTIQSLKLNTIFPLEIGSALIDTDVKVIQIATDCVFDGLIGNYSETSVHTASDWYGRSKSLGEVDSKNFMHIRTSIIGREIVTKNSLLTWFLSMEKDEIALGYSNHLWNGVTTLAFARMTSGIIENDCFRPTIQHFIPSDTVSKFELLNCFRAKFNRMDIKLIPHNEAIPINRVLVTENVEFNEFLWEVAGYSTIPKIEELVQELALSTN